MNKCSDISLYSNYNNSHPKGKIELRLYNHDQESSVVELIDENGKQSIFSMANEQLIIKDLNYGKYSIKISDQYNLCKIYNQNSISKDFYDLEILDSFEKYQAFYQEKHQNLLKIDKAFLNRYDNMISKKILFMSPNHKNGVLINIFPLDACYDILDQNKNIVVQDCGYGFIDLEMGKYLVRGYKNGYIEKTVEFFHNSKKDLVDLFLQQETDEFFDKGF